MQRPGKNTDATARMARAARVPPTAVRQPATAAAATTMIAASTNSTSAPPNAVTATVQFNGESPLANAVTILMTICLPPFLPTRARPCAPSDP